MWVVRFISVGKPGGMADGDGWNDGAVTVPGEPFGVFEEKSRVRIYFKEEVESEEEKVANRLVDLDQRVVVDVSEESPKDNFNYE